MDVIIIYIYIKLYNKCNFYIKNCFKKKNFFFFLALNNCEWDNNLLFKFTSIIIVLKS